MPVIAITTQSYAAPDLIVQELESAYNCKLYSDQDLIEFTRKHHGIKTGLLERVIQGKTIAFDNFTHEREKTLSALKKTLADLICQGDCFFTGFISHMIPEFITHVFHILIQEEEEQRIKNAMDIEGYTRSKAEAAVQKADQYADKWLKILKNRSPWDHSLYDFVISMDDTDKAGSAIGQIQTSLSSPPFSSMEIRKKELVDLQIQADADMVLASMGSGLLVSSSQGHVIVTLDKKILNLSKTQNAIMTAVNKISGVKSVKTKIGPNYYKGNVIKTFDFGRSTGPSEWDTDNKKN